MSTRATTVRQMSPRDLLDEQLDLHVWWESAAGKRFGRGFLRSFAAVSGMPAGHLNRPWASVLGLNGEDYVWYTQSLVCRTAMPILVQPDMIDLIEHAAKTMPPQPFREADVPADAGFMYFTRPVPIVDIKGKDFLVRAVSWGKIQMSDPMNPRPHDIREGEPGVLCAFYTSEKDDPDDPFNIENAERRAQGMWIPDLSMLHLQALAYGYDYTQREFFMAPTDRQVDPEIKDAAEEATKRIVMFVMTAWTIMQQRIAVTYRTKPARPQARRWARRKAIPPEVTVVTLRRADQGHEPTEDHTLVEYSHRWFVTGHWRKIRHPRTDEERLVWVSPHIKGPEDKPLLFKDRVYNFRR